ncbi:MAG: hypothetical protein RLZZ450_3143 [Pseudomonadota bacterium]
MTFPRRQKTEKKATRVATKKSATRSTDGKKSYGPRATKGAASGQRASEPEPRKVSARGGRTRQEGDKDDGRKRGGRADSRVGTDDGPKVRNADNRKGELRRGRAGSRGKDDKKPDPRHLDPRKSGLRRPGAPIRELRVGDLRRAAKRASEAALDPKKAVRSKVARPRAEARKGSEPRAERRKFTPRTAAEPRPEARKFEPAKAASPRGQARKFEPRKGTVVRPLRSGASTTRSRTEEPRASTKFDGRKTHARKVPDGQQRDLATSTGKARPRVSTGRAVGAKRAGSSPARDENVRVFVPLTPTPSPLRRTTKPLERKRPDLSEEPHPGHYLITTREGSEQDVIDELTLAGVVDPPPRILAPALVLAPKVPKNDKRPIELSFARQGFPILVSVHAHDLDEVSQRISRSLRGQLEKAKEYALHVWVPDSDLGNPLAAMATELEEKIMAQLTVSLPDARRVDDGALRRLGSMLFAQVCLIDPERAVAGVTYSNAALSLARGGRTRVRVTGHFPSRAARKLEEALAWLGVEPGAGELCVDLGAAPGGWTYVLADRRARVIAVDPANLKPEILAMKGVQHVKQSAFNYKPDAEVDWLFCDMAWRPLEAAALLAKWGRNRWARMVVANIKLPMTKKAEIVARVRHILATEGDWKHIRVRQLYHDRDEITLSAHVG